jgi:hypothetical protein
VISWMQSFRNGPRNFCFVKTASILSQNSSSVTDIIIFPQSEIMKLFFKFAHEKRYCLKYIDKNDTICSKKRNYIIILYPRSKYLKKSERAKKHNTVQDMGADDINC